MSSPSLSVAREAPRERRHVYLTVHELADLLRVTPRTIAAWVRTRPGFPRALSIGGKKVLFNRRAVRAYLATLEAGTGGAV